MQPSTSRPDDPAKPADEAATALPRETLRGERLCMKCLQPLLGRPVEREPETGLLHVRCGECGTAAALFEYPTLAPWMRRMRAVVATSLATLAFVTAIVVAGIAGLFAGVTGPVVSEEAGDALSTSWQEATSATPDPQGFSFSGWSPADMSWIASPEGQRAFGEALWSRGALEPQLVIPAFATSMLTIAALALGGALLRHRAPMRMLLAALPALVGVSIATLIVDTMTSSLFGGLAQPTWRQLCEREYATSVTLANGAFYVAWTSLCALAAPSVVATIARTILPPSDRRLVAWIWEWRGMPVPRD